MKCPICAEHSPDAWQGFSTSVSGGMMGELPATPESVETVRLDWMRCANNECQQLIVRATEKRLSEARSSVRANSWIVRPRFGETRRPIHAAVPEPFRTDYAEAAAILPLSPRMSAVLSRRVLADLLEKYANQMQFSLTDRIDKFVADTTQPAQLRDNLHHFRAIGDFGAHTQKDDQTEVIDVGQAEAEWTLDLLDRLFDHFIVGPERDRKMREAMDERIRNAGRKPIEPPDDSAEAGL